MGWECRDVGLRVSLRLDAHAGDKEREHERLAGKLEAELSAATLAILRKPEYAEILLFKPEYYAVESM
jgi:hypothetical protein